MIESKLRRDLVVLVADNSMKTMLNGILQRPKSLGIRDIKFKLLTSIHRDPGCLNLSDEILRPYVNRSNYALVVLDREGCGKEKKSNRFQLEIEIEKRLAISGWEDRAVAVVIDPELENWIWSDSPRVDAVLGWKGSDPALRDWLKKKQFYRKGPLKPSPPKEAMEDALREVQKPWSSDIFFQVASTVSFKRCNDPAFLKLKNTLKLWFSES